MTDAWAGDGQGGARGAGRALDALTRTLAAEGDRLFLWGPVLFAVGIAIYFALEREPSPLVPAAALVGALAVFLLVRPWPLVGLAAAGLLCAGLGFVDICLRTWRVAAPLIAADTGVVTIRGWMERVETRAPRGYRVTIRVRSVEGRRVHAVPYRVRIRSAFAVRPPPPATPVEVRAVLQPLPEPVQPHGFDFARSAWFARIGAIGFAIAPPLADPAGPKPPLDLRLLAAIDVLRTAIAERIAAVLDGVPRALATALITGERGEIPDEVLAALRNSGLAHVLAISGLHMALMAGTLYWLARALLAALPPLALAYPIKKWAACVALAGGAFYLALSGASVATQRAFIMMAIVFIAVLLERPALTLRNVAIAAWIVLALLPESLFEVSFQMSFAAVVALVAVYEVTARQAEPWTARTLWGRLGFRCVAYLLGIALTTLVASLAIAPYSAYHFHTLAQYGLIANMLAMPLVGLVVMPSALAALLAMPFGLETWPLRAMGFGLEWLVGVARTVANWEGAVLHLPAMSAPALALITLGGLWLCLWRTRWRLAGPALAALGLFAAPSGSRPDVLIARDGELIALRDEGGRLVTARPRANYSLRQWLLADGDERAPRQAADSAAFACDDLACLATVKGKRIAVIRHPAALAEECARVDIIIVPFPFSGPCTRARVVIDRIDVWAEGAHALFLDGQSIKVETVAGTRGERPWVLARRRREATPVGAAVAEESESDGDQ